MNTPSFPPHVKREFKYKGKVYWIVPSIIPYGEETDGWETCHMCAFGNASMTSCKMLEKVGCIITDEQIDITAAFFIALHFEQYDEYLAERVIQELTS